ncbi:MAG: hypothetical protein CMG61_01630 [Candidatus Marinimicrobia bacterium]|nr:hypothetical protein [Candidatus Neomarinimicrobiota bacterium]
MNQKILKLMHNFLMHLLIIFLSIIVMEIVAIFAHKYIMHGPGWFLHKSHHKKHNNKFELNDLYFIFFSIPSIYCIYFGFSNQNFILTSIGIGTLCYGLIYIILHDIVVHKRFGIRIKSKNYYLRKIKKSHLIHHSNQEKKDASNFGFISFL